MNATSRPDGYETPRLWSRPLRELTPETSFGFEAIEFAQRVLGRKLYAWQAWLLIHMLELTPGSFTSDKYPRLRFKTILILVSRQNGKSFIMSTRLLWRMIMWEGPEVEPPLILGSAHKRPAAFEILDLSVKTMRRVPEARGMIASYIQGNGLEHLELANGARWTIEAANDDGGRSLSVTDLGFDELRQQYGWEAWSALTNTTNARFSSQVIAVSNAGSARAVVLKALRSQALSRIAEHDAFVGSNEDFAARHDTTLGLFEWSAPDDAAVTDVEALAQANPAVGHRNENGEILLTWEMLLSKAALVGKGGEDGVPEHVFRIENMCQFVVASKEGPFPEEKILACIDDASEIMPGSPIVLAVDVSADRSKGYLAVAGWRADGLPHVEVIVERAATEWIPKTIAKALEDNPDIKMVVAQGRGAPVSSLVEYIEYEDVKVNPCQGLDSTSACGRFSDRVMREVQATDKYATPLFEDGQPVMVVAPEIRFRDDSSLMLALREAAKSGFKDTWEWSRKGSPVDVAPLCAVTEALWGLEQLGLAPHIVPFVMPALNEVAVMSDLYATIDGPNIATIQF